jgi:hypothetical protein
MIKGSVWIGGLAICAGIGCAATQVRTDHDAAAPMARYRTFALKRGKIVNEGVLDSRDTLTRDRINEALEEKLAQKGLQPTNLNPDLIVTFTAGERTRRKVTTFPGEAYAVDGYWSAGPGPGYWNIPYGGSAYSTAPYRWITNSRQGVIVIDLIDANTNKLVWRSTARAEDVDFRKPKNIERTVGKALDKLPAIAG